MTKHVDPTNGPAAAIATGIGNLVSRRQLFALAGGAALLAACSKKAAVSTPDTVPDTTPDTAAPSTLGEDTEAPTVATTAPPTTVAPAPVEPLTGRPLVDATLPAKAALVVKVSNDLGARPQTGLNDADIVFEAWGAGPTRFATIWHSRDHDFVGPIRSCREQDVNLVGEFNRALFACSGGNPGNLALLRSSDLLLITEGQGPGWELDPRRRRPHKTHANTALLRTNARPDRTGPKQQFHYRPVGAAATAGAPMTGFDLQIQQVFVQWRYDAASATYKRTQDRHPHILADGAQVSTDNVVIVWLDYNASHTDRRSPDGITTGSGAANVFTGGRLISGRWTRADRLAPFALADAAGKPILLTPGRTFIELPNSGKGAFPGNDRFTPLA